ncbi:caspase family protein [Streptomyces sp. NPDC050211]|uniref:caspase, EACC1-associated type n=1 Tax=Streptomyces sp. NPDC050211 TaxID=3154932 RepID=UPI00342C790E
MIRLPDPEGSRAFLFGTATYEADDLADLPAVANNLDDLRAALTSPLGAFAAERCTVLLDPAGSIPVYDALRHHAAAATDTLLIYFAGHGLRKLRGGLYLGLPHTQSANAAVSGFDYDLLREIVNSSSATNKIVIVDSCFSGRAIQGMSGVAQDLDIEGSCLLTATTANEQALAPPGKPYTTFTGELLHLLRHGIPDAGPLLSLGVIAEELRRSARRRELPIPEQQFRGTTQHIALTRNPAAPTTDAPPTPPVPPPPRPSVQHAYVSRALVFAGTSHATKKDLAETIRTHWSTAADRFFGHMGTEAHPTESWAELRSWLRQFNDLRTDDVEGRIVLIDRCLTNSALRPHHKLLHLLRWLDPDGPVVYRGRPITYDTLTAVCLYRYVGGGRRDAELLKELAKEHRLLDTLAGFTTLDQLRGVHRQWAEALKAWQAADTTWWPPEVRDWASDVGPGALLAALLPPEHLEEVRPRWQGGEARPPDTSTVWYDRLLQAAEGRNTLLGQLAEADWSERAQGEALAEAEKRELRRRAEELAQKQRLKQEQEERERRQAEEQRRQEQQRRAEEEERQRRLKEAQEEEQRRQREREWKAAAAAQVRPAARAMAVLRALALGLGWALLPLVLIWLSWWFSSYEFDAAQTLSVLTGVASFSAMVMLIPCAAQLGGNFRPRLRVPWSWLPAPRGTLVAGTLLLVFGLISSDTSLRSGSFKADSDLLREAGLSAFLEYVGANSYSPSGWDILVSLLLVPVLAGCVFAGLHAGRATARRWEEHTARAQQEAYPLTQSP